MQTIGPLGRRFGLILTLHDTIYYRHRTPPRDLPWYVRLGWRLFHLSYVPQRLTLDAADVVATVSETSAAEFARAPDPRPVVVVPNAPQRLADLLPAGAVEPGARTSCTWARSCRTRTSRRSSVRPRTSPDARSTCCRASRPTGVPSSSSSIRGARSSSTAA
jgi:hypothetical protein